MIDSLEKNVGYLNVLMNLQRNKIKILKQRSTRLRFNSLISMSRRTESNSCIEVQVVLRFKEKCLCSRYSIWVRNVQPVMILNPSANNRRTRLNN